MYFVDTHTHLYLEQFNGDRNMIVNKAIECGIKKMLLPNIDSSSIQDLLNLCEEFPENCFPMMGLHPTSVKENYKKELDTIEKRLFENPSQFCAIGEIGIDLYWDKTYFNEQKEAFLKQIDWAIELQLPIVIHARDSFEEIFETIKPKISPELTGVFHSFTGTIEHAKKIIDWGFKIGIGGIVTFKKAGLDVVVKEIPLEHIILETDSPFLTPAPFRGKRNESSYIKYIAKKISEIFDIDIEEVAKITTTTAENLLNLKTNMEFQSQVSVLIIYTGGTIGMMEDPESHSLKPFDMDNIIVEVPELKKFGFKLDHIAFDPLIDSSDVNPAFWVKIADTIYENYDSYNGFVVLHGTDTMAYTASALSFMFENLTKPIILTGSQLPIGNIRTDGKENLISSVEIAAAEISGNALVPEVCVYFENKLYRGNRITKLNAEYFNAFYSGNCTPLAKSGVYINYQYEKIIYPEKGKEVILHKNLENNIAILKIFPGISPELIRAVTETENLKAIILETFGAGNAPTDEGFLCAIRNATSKGIIVLNVSQCLQGSVDQGKYETSAELDRIGIISGYDITTEAALTKLMVLFGRKLDRDELIFNLNKSIAGEITPI